MDINDIPTGEIVARKIDVKPINDAIKKRAMQLGEQMEPDAASQFVSDMQTLECFVKGEGQDLSFSIKPSESYFLKFLEDPYTPVLGGQNGMVHELDGSVRETRVRKQLWDTPTNYEFPKIEGEEEAMHIVSLMSLDAGEDGLRKSMNDLGEAYQPYFQQNVYQMFGGGLS